jgi:hypothetical protein
MGTWSPPSLRRTVERVLRTAAPPDDVPRIANPFARFHTRSRWLAVVMREGRDADPARRIQTERLHR